MSNNPLIVQSKLPNLGTTIFTQMSALAQQHRRDFLILMVHISCRNVWHIMSRMAQTSMRR